MTRPWLALAAMLLVQVVVSLTLVAASVLAPAVAPTLGLAPERIGLYAAVAYLTAMLSGLRAGHWVARIGSLRLSQVALLACAGGALLAAASPALGAAGALLGAAFLIGIGYGLVNPAAAAVLTHHAPTTSRGLFFSIKQTGVPIGVAMAGLLMPLGLSLLGWRATAVGLAALCAVLGQGNSFSVVGWPEKLFARVNAVLPRLVDGALRKQLPIIRRYAAPKSPAAGETP